MTKAKNIYFASDFHLGGASSLKENIIREKYIVRWLNQVRIDAKSIYLLGDVFDFWFEYKKVVPKGFIRLLGKLAELSDDGIEIHIVTGNHDLWMKDYFTEHIGVNIHHTSFIIKAFEKKLLIGHGDGLGDGDYFYKLFLKKIFTSKICQWLFRRLYPDVSISLAQFWSRKSAKKKGSPKFESEEKEILLGYCKKQQEKQHIDYYIFGHRHLPLEIPIQNNSMYINLGDWITHFTYAVFDGDQVKLKKF